MQIYKTTNIINGKVYVGKEKYNNPKYLGSGKILKLAIKKYGRNSFRKEILEECDNYDYWLSREIYWIDFLDAINTGYNIAAGGSGGDTMTFNPNKAAIYEKISRTRLSKSPEEIIDIKLRKSNSLKETWKELKNTHSDKLADRNKRISEKQKGRPKSIESINKLKKTLRDNKTHDGENNSMFGKCHSEKTKSLIKDKLKGNKNSLGSFTSSFKFFKDEIFIHECIGQLSAKIFCKENNISFQTLCKKSTIWKNWRCERNKKQQL